MIREVKQVSHERIIHDAKVKVGSSNSLWKSRNCNLLISILDMTAINSKNRIFLNLCDSKVRINSPK